jgi:hypothetical protein
MISLSDPQGVSVRDLLTQEANHSGTVEVAGAPNEGADSGRAVMILREELEDIDFLRKVGEQDLAKIALAARLMECPPGMVLFREGQSVSSVYLVLSGRITLMVNEGGEEAVGVYTAGSGELLGWSPLLGGRAMTATACAATRCRLAVFDVHQVQELCEMHPRFGVAFLAGSRAVLVRSLQGRSASPRPCAWPSDTARCRRGGE